MPKATLRIHPAQISGSEVHEIQLHGKGCPLQSNANNFVNWVLGTIASHDIATRDLYGMTRSDIAYHGCDMLLIFDETLEGVTNE